MRPVIVAPLVAAIDDRAAQLGGVQSLVADLASGLAAAGHEVALIAPRRSHVRGVRVVDLDIDASLFTPAVLDRPAPRVDDARQRAAFGRVRSWIDANTMHVIHAHAYDAPAFSALDGSAVPVVHTLHLPPNDPTVVTAARRARATLITVSQANAAAWMQADAEVREVIVNGVDVDRIPFGGGEGGYLLAAGRIAPEKGVDAAARVARAAGMPLVVAGGVYDAAARDAIGRDGVTLTGPVPRHELFRIMGRARALLMPVTWDEPFGLVAIGSMAAGTPVVAYRRGGLPEVIVDGSTGWLVDPGDESAFAAAVRRVGEIDRAACRAHVAATFSLERMVNAHVALYRAL